MIRDTDLAYMDYIDITDAYIGSVIESVVEKFYLNEIDLETEYGDLLAYIARRLIEGKYHKRKPSPAEYERFLTRLARSRGIVFNVVSFLVSRYLEERGLVASGEAEEE